MNTLKSKMLFIALTALGVTPIHADNWFVRPDITTTSGDGHSWEGALCVSDFQMLLSNELASEGDMFHLAEGIYTPESNANTFKITQGVAIVGGYPQGLSGTDLSRSADPFAHPTVFSGDKNGDGLPNAGDIQNLLVISGNEKVSIQRIRFECAYYQGEDYGAGALYTDNANVEIKNCEFRNNTSTFHGGAGFTSVGSFTHFIDCTFTDNTAKSRGGAILIDTAPVEKGGRKSTCMLERCQLSGNSVAHEITDGKYGGAIQIRHGNLWVINSTIADNKAYCNGAGISISNGDTAYIVSSTLANNICSRIHIDLDKSYSYGSSIRMEKEAVLYIANSISLEGTEDTGNKRNPTCYTENYTKSIENYFISGGYNYLGTFYDLSKKYQDPVWNLIWKSTDQPSTPVAVHQYADMFHTNQLADNGGESYTILPAVQANGATISELREILEQWKCPDQVAVELDQRGYSRETNTCMGAVDVNGISAINRPVVASKTLLNIGNGRYKIPGAKNIRIFNANGHLLSNVFGESVDLSSLPQGLYLIHSDGTTFKVIK